MRVYALGSTEGYNLEGYVIKALKSTGTETNFAGYLDPGKSLNLAARLLLSRSRVARGVFSKVLFKKYMMKVENEITNYNPDSIIIFKGDFLEESFFREIRKLVDSKIIFWFPDDPRFFTSLALPTASESDLTITFSDRARERYRELGIDSVRVPFAASDIHIYRETEKKYDITFIGNLGRKRLTLTKKLIRDGFKVRIFGSYWNGFIPSDFLSPPVFGPDMVSIINQSKISLNFHQDVNFGPNMRFFEITASGGTMVTDNAEDSKKFVDERGAMFYENYEELKERITEAIQGDNIKLRLHASSIVHRDHMYTNRVSEVAKLMQ